MRKRTTAAAATVGAAVLGGSLFVLTQNSADAAPTPAQWSCTGSTSYAASVRPTITAVRGTKKQSQIVTVTVSGPSGSTTPQGTVYFGTSPYSSTSGSYSTTNSGTLSNGSVALDTGSSSANKYFAFEPSTTTTVYCAVATTGAF